MNPKITRCLNCLEEKGEALLCPHCGKADTNLPVASHLLAPGVVLNDCYLIGVALGHRHFGATYLAYDLEAQCKRVIKEYLPRDLVHRAADSQKIKLSSSRQASLFDKGLAAFTEESTLLQRLPAQPGLAKIRAFFRANETAYRVMDYIDGQTLDEFLPDSPPGLSFHLLLKTFAPLLTALEQSHNLGLCHLDIHPGNIIITPEGIATLVNFSQSSYRYAQFSDMLTAYAREGYSPKEIYFRSEVAGAPADVYSLAACFYLALTNQAPLDALARIRNDALRRPSRLGKLIPLEAESVLMKALSIRPDSRFPTISDFTDNIFSASQTESPRQKLSDQNVFVRVACGFCSSVNEVLKTDLQSGTVACVTCHRALTEDDVHPAVESPVEPRNAAGASPPNPADAHYLEVFTIVKCRVCESENEILKNDLHMGARCLACGNLLLTPEDYSAETEELPEPSPDSETIAPGIPPEAPSPASRPGEDDPAAEETPAPELSGQEDTVEQEIIPEDSEPPELPGQEDTVEQEIIPEDSAPPELSATLPEEPAPVEPEDSAAPEELRTTEPPEDSAAAQPGPGDDTGETDSGDVEEDQEEFRQASQALIAEVEQVLQEEPESQADTGLNGQGKLPDETAEAAPENPFSEMELEEETADGEAPVEAAQEPAPETAAPPIEATPPPQEESVEETALLAEEMEISPVMEPAHGEPAEEELTEITCPKCGAVNTLPSSAVMGGATCQQCKHAFLSLLPSESDESAADKKSPRRTRKAQASPRKLWPVILLVLTLALAAAGLWGYRYFQSRQEQQQTYNEQLAAGNRYFTSGDYRSALDYYQKALAIRPNDAYLQQQIGKSEELLQLLQAEQLEEQEQFRYFQVINRADSLYDLGQMEQAKEMYRRTLEEFPDDFYAQSQIEDIQAQFTRSKAAPVRKPKPVVYAVKAGDSLPEIIARARPGGIVKLPSGILEFSKPIPVTRNLSIVGAGANQTILVYKGGGIAFTVDKNQQLSIQGISLEATGDSGATLIRVRDARLEIRKANLKGAKAGRDPALPGAAVIFSGNSQGNIAGCKFLENAVAVLIDDLSRPTLSENDFRENQAAIIIRNRARPTIRNNRIRNNFGNGIEVFDRSQPVIENNEVYENRGNGVYFHTESYSGKVKINTIRRNKEIGILLEGNSQATFEGNMISANGLGGIEFRNGSRGILRKNVIKDNKYSGVKIVNQAHPTITENEIIENQGDGIEIRDKAKPTVDGNTIRKNAGDGISLLLTQDGGYIRNNVSTGNQGYGISILKLPRPTLLNNTATGNYEGSVYEENPLN